MREAAGYRSRSRAEERAIGRRALRLLHTSDVHLGSGDEEGHSALEAVMTLGLALRADALLIAGDLFDHNRVGEEEVARFQMQVGHFGRPVVVLPGNHDCLDDLSVYRRPSFDTIPSNLHLLTEPDGVPLLLPRLGLEVWGRPTVDHHHTFRPLRDVPARQGDSWYVVLAHGHLVEGSNRPLFSAPITPEEIARVPCDYIALGHAEGFRDISQGSVRACYSGTPRLRGSGGLGTFALVEFSELGVRVERHSLR